MKIAILSDAHDAKDNMQLAVQKITEQGADVLLFCGDFCAPPLAKVLTDFKNPIHVVFGNNDGDRFTMVKVTAAASHLTFHGEYADLVLDGKRVGMTHYPFYAEKMAKSGDFDLVAFGHDHAARIEDHGACLAINPGSLNPAMTQTVGFAIYDTATHTAELFGLN